MLFATEDVDVIRDGASRIRSGAGSRRNSISAWLFSTYHTAVHNGSVRNHGSSTAHTSVPPRWSSFCSRPCRLLVTKPKFRQFPPPFTVSRSISSGPHGDPDPFGATSHRTAESMDSCVAKSMVNIPIHLLNHSLGVAVPCVTKRPWRT
jgi:hypothetical protein